MGTITTTTDHETLDAFLNRVDSAQTSLIQAIRANNALRASFAEAEARMIVLESIDPNVAAYLLRFCDQRLSMVEVVNTGDKDRMVQVMALAILNGFVPGREQFGIHTGKLYVKEAGYRKLFAMIGDCSPADVSVGHPELKDLGNGRKVWLVDGVASVTFQGLEHSVECVGDYAVGIPSNATDHIDGIKTKARRRLLQLLWKKVSAIELDDSEDEFQVGQPSVQVVEPAKQIPESPPQGEAKNVPSEEHWNYQWKVAAKTVGHSEGDPHVLITFARTIRDAKTVEEMDTVLADAKQCVGKERYEFSQRFMIRLQEYKQWRESQLVNQE